MTKTVLIDETMAEALNSAFGRDPEYLKLTQGIEVNFASEAFQAASSQFVQHVSEQSARRLDESMTQQMATLVISYHVDYQAHQVDQLQSSYRRAVRSTINQMSELQQELSTSFARMERSGEFTAEQLTAVSTEQQQVVDGFEQDQSAAINRVRHAALLAEEELSHLQSEHFELMAQRSLTQQPTTSLSAEQEIARIIFEEPLNSVAEAFTDSLEHSELYQQLSEEDQEHVEHLVQFEKDYLMQQLFDHGLRVSNDSQFQVAQDTFDHVSQEQLDQLSQARNKTPDQSAANEAKQAAEHSSSARDIGLFSTRKGPESPKDQKPSSDKDASDDPSPDESDDQFRPR